MWRHCVTRLQVRPVGVRTLAELRCGRGGLCKLYTMDRVSFVLWSDFGRCAVSVRGLFVDWTVDVPRDSRRDPSSTNGCLEALGYWTHLCDRARRKTDAWLFVSNEYLSCRFGCTIEPAGFIMNKHTQCRSWEQ